ncbi:MAG: glycerophosphodiester phosphodiesterase [Sandaracinaceae bacterium]|nr:glycerophosphodiester phosphodiesterase [Sandaracinaceae bacterium]
MENTLAAFRLAIEEGADGVELDVRATRDGQVVVFHDRDLARLAGDPRAVAELDRGELPSVGGAPIPTLDEVLDLVLGAGLEVNVEIKAGSAACGEVLAARAPDELSRIVVSSFHAPALATCRRAVPTVRTAFLFERAEDVPPAVLAEIQGVHPHFPACSEAQVAAWRERGLFVNVWTVNDPSVARSLAAMQVDGLVTDEVPTVRGACEMRS